MQKEKGGSIWEEEKKLKGDRCGGRSGKGDGWGGSKNTYVLNAY